MEHVARTAALASGFGHALLACSLFLVAAAVIAARTDSTRGHQVPSPEGVPVPEAA